MFEIRPTLAETLAPLPLTQDHAPGARSDLSRFRIMLQTHVRLIDHKRRLLPADFIGSLLEGPKKQTSTSLCISLETLLGLYKLVVELVGFTFELSKQ